MECVTASVSERVGLRVRCAIAVYNDARGADVGTKLELFERLRRIASRRVKKACCRRSSRTRAMRRRGGAMLRFNAGCSSCLWICFASWATARRSCSRP